MPTNILNLRDQFCQSSNLFENFSGNGSLTALPKLASPRDTILLTVPRSNQSAPLPCKVSDSQSLPTTNQLAKSLSVRPSKRSSQYRQVYCSKEARSVNSLKQSLSVSSQSFLCSSQSLFCLTLQLQSEPSAHCLSQSGIPVRLSISACIHTRVKQWLWSVPAGCSKLSFNTPPWMHTVMQTLLQVPLCSLHHSGGSVVVSLGSILLSEQA